MTASRAWIVGLLLVTAGLAGCMGDSGEDAQAASQDPSEGSNETQTNGTEVQPEDSGLNVTVAWHNGSVQGRTVPGLGPVCYLDCGSSSFEFNVSGETTAIQAEVVWDADTSMFFDMDIPFETCDAGFNEDCPPESTSGDSPIVQPVTDPQTIEPGNWTASVFAEDSPAQSVEFTVAISLFQGEAIPSDYSKIADRSAP